MSDTSYTRTTIVLPDNLLYEVKKRALEERRTIKDIISDGIRSYVKKPIKKSVDEKERLGLLAESVVGSLDLSKYPQWKTKRKVHIWLRKLRSEWE